MRNNIKNNRVRLDNKKSIQFPKSVKKFTIIHSNSLINLETDNHKSPMTLATTKTITTGDYEHNITTLATYKYNVSTENNYNIITQILEAYYTTVAPTNVTNVMKDFDYPNVTFNLTESIGEIRNMTNNITNTQFVLNSGNTEFRIRYYSFLICVGLSILVMAILLTIISIHQNFKCVNRDRYKYVVNLIHEQGIEINTMRETRI